MRTLSIKLRVTLWYVLLMLVLIALVIGIMLASNESATLEGIEARLRSVVEENMDEVEYDHGKVDIDEDFAFNMDGVASAVYSDDQGLLAGGLPAAFDPPLAFEDGAFRVANAEGQRWGVYDRVVTSKKHRDLWVRGVTRMDAFASTSGTVLQVALIALPLWLLLAAIGGYIIAGRSFRPVEDIRQAADAIAGGHDLSRRIDLGEGSDEIHRLGETLNRMLERLEASFEVERQFTADASHELRTPTAVILSQCEYALERDRTPETQRESLEAIRQQATRMSRLIAQLLAFARMERGSGAFAPEETDISELTTFVCEDYAETSPDGAALIRAIPDGITACVDRTLYARALSNLIDNALRHGGPPISVTLSRADSAAILTVRDEGPGIDPSQLSLIWNRFYRVDAARTHDAYGHTGLGLAIVRQIMQMHGGTAEAASQPGQGSAFTLRFPVKKSRALS
ncbi:HAMP domain-containing histidine kinase [Eubacteriales bacterium OttesenSCG-928-A19]|nr:HAMP domain-containing histidine kinase [Eubacteriales bacterium OttesenSCG-928-A19]